MRESIISTLAGKGRTTPNHLVGIKVLWWVGILWYYSDV